MTAHVSSLSVQSIILGLLTAAIPALLLVAASFTSYSLTCTSRPSPGAWPGSFLPHRLFRQPFSPVL